MGAIMSLTPALFRNSFLFYLRADGLDSGRLDCAGLENVKQEGRFFANAVRVACSSITGILFR
jgi:hypothetical protein